MTIQQRRFPRLVPLVGALSLALVASTAAHAQSAATTPAVSAASQEVALTAAERQQLVGTYVLTMAGMPGRSMPFRVYEEQGALYGQPQGGEPKRMIHQGGFRFRPDGDPVAVVSFTVEAGKPTRFTVVTPEGNLEGTRESEAAR